MTDPIRKLKDRASRAFGEGRLKPALKLYLEALDLDPGEMSVRVKLGDVHRKLGNKREAIEAYEAVARHYAEDGLLLKAIAVGKQILTMDPTHTRTQEMLAGLYAKREGRQAYVPRTAPTPADLAAPLELSGAASDPLVVERGHTLPDFGPAAASSPKPAAPFAAWSVAPSGVPTVVVGTPVAAPAVVPRPTAPAGFAWPVGPTSSPPAAPPRTPPVGWPVTAPTSVEPPRSGASSAISAPPPVVLGALGAPPPPALGADAGRAQVAADRAAERGLDDRVASAAGAPPRAEVPVLGATEALGIVFAEERGAPDAASADAPAPAPAALDGAVEPASLARVPGGAEGRGPGVAGEREGLGLPRIPLFSELPGEAFISILVEMPMRELAPGAYVIRQGEVGSSFFVLAAGRVRVERQSEDGSTTVLAYLTEGAFFGEMALLQDGARVASVIVEEDAQLFEIGRGLLERIHARFPAVTEVVRNFYMQRLLSTTMATHPMFRSFSPEDRRALMARFKSRVFQPGETLVQEGQRGDGLYVLLTGKAEVTRAKDGEALLVAELGAGDMFGEMSMLANRPTVAAVTVVRECVVLRLARQDFEEVIMTHPQVLEHVARLSEEREASNASASAFDGFMPRLQPGAALV